jgi:hypothetical protein
MLKAVRPKYCNRQPEYAWGGPLSLLAARRGG